VGVLGLRQVGKSTLVRNLADKSAYLTMDDDDVRTDAEASAKAFLAKYRPPVIIDEVQKTPLLFDAVKSAVDRKRVPGSFYLTGSSSFSGQKNIQESLTGRIGLCELYPLTLAEAEEKPLIGLPKPIHSRSARFGIETLSRRLWGGGMPVPMFSRDDNVRTQYWKSWFATALGRDLARVYGRGYDADFAERILYELVKHHEDGIFPDLSDFKADSRKVKKYLNALRGIFVLRMLPCHEAGTGRDVYFLADSGMAHSLMNGRTSEAISLSLTRIYALNEIFANTHYSGQTPRWTYFKSQKGSPIDLVWDGIPIKIISSIKRTGWEERVIFGAMKKLGSAKGLLVGPTDVVTAPKKNEVGLVPWTFWS
jgi:predicted AAA+ superfamily ATPase